MIELDQNLDGRKIDLPVGETLMINLTENATTGFSWHLKENPGSSLVVEDEAFIPPESIEVGQPGTRRWLLKGAESGTVTLEFQYQRPWEKRPERKLKLTVKVT
jgi:predicted secreted protein